MIHWDYILSGTEADSPKKSNFADFCQLKVTFFGKTHQIPALTKKHNS